MAAFDTETTGPDPTEARLVTAALDLYDENGEVLDRARWVIDPGVEIPAEAAEVHGYTTERARDEGRPPAECITEIYDRLSWYWTAGYPAVAYNAAFDFTVLDREMRRHLDRPLEILGPIIDPLVLDKVVDRYVKGKGQRRLAPTAERYGLVVENWHEAGADAWAAHAIARKVGEVHGDRLPTDLRDLWTFQARAARESAASLTDHWRRRGETEADGSPKIADGHWPVRPVPEATS